eukprot:m.298032 g.298032  ORF g.298032 m.298032 type:complete len:836 (-) comp15859_c3_seq1:96-2603(-)
MGDDMYSGYNDYDLALDVNGLEDAGFQKALQTAHGGRPGVKTSRPPVGPQGAGARMTTGMARMGTARMGTAMRVAGGAGGHRPTTSVQGTGFSSRDPSASFDPSRSVGAPAQLEKLEDTRPEALLKKLEAKVHELLESSARAIDKQDFQKALEKAQEACTHEKQFAREKEQLLGVEQVNFDLTFAVILHLACVQEQCEMYPEAISTLNILIKDKSYDRAGRLRVNVGNIYYKQKKYTQAVKQYRMALDQVPAEKESMRNAIMRNVGHCFIRLGQYNDAMKTFEHIIAQTPVRVLDGTERHEPGRDFESAFNCLLCYLALGERDKMKKGFLKLLSLQCAGLMDEERYTNIRDDEQVQIYLDAVKEDPLRMWEREKLEEAQHYILTAAKLISPVIESSLAEGYDWCIDNVKQSLFNSLSPELEITKALEFLKMKEFKAAATVLKSFEKKDSSMLSTAATNLSFLYYLEGETRLAERYADMAIKADSYNPFALVNKGNCKMKVGEYEDALACYHDAMSIDSSSLEALYNAGLAHKQLGNLEDALDFFTRANTLLSDNPEITYQLADLNEKLGDMEQALEWYGVLTNLVPNDPNALAHLGRLFDQEEDKTRAFQHHSEAFQCFPSDIDTIAWFGSYYIESQFIDRAVEYFQRAVEVQPGEVKWRLMIASCHRRTGNYQKALDAYKRIHRLFPENIECLTFLIRLCRDMDLPEVEDYEAAMKRAELAKNRREAQQRQPSGRRTKSGRKTSARRREGAEGSARTQREREMRADGYRSPSIEVQPDVQPDAQSPMSPEAAAEVTYQDPMGALPPRPKTAARTAQNPDEDEWGDIDEDELLPM